MGSTYRKHFELYDLIETGDSRSVEEFLNDNRIDVNVILPYKGVGVLHLAVGVEPLEKSKECTQILLKYGGDPNLCTDDGATPVHIAAIWGRVENLQLLLGYGGDPSILDMDGHSASMYACAHRQWEVLEYLQQPKNTDATNNPLRHLSTCRNPEMVQDWCKKTILVMNNLYPKIQGDKLLQDESVPWNSIDLTINSTIDLTKNSTIDFTEDEVSNKTYVIFPLPGCSNSTRRKISLTKCKKHMLSSDFMKLSVEDSQLTEDSISDLNKGYIVDWHSQSQNEAINTRRSSASSGVSSFLSGVGIVQEYKDQDEEEDVILIE